MGGGLIQLVAYGPQDMFLTKDPQITFFKVVYRRHTNFSSEPIPQNFTHTPGFGKKVTCILSKNGDLIEKMYLMTILPEVPQFLDDAGNVDNVTKFAWVRKIGYALVSSIEIEIGGTLIDRHYGEWLNIWNELTGPADRGIANMIGDTKILTDFTNGKQAYQLYIPLQFWFCRENGLALPIVCLQHNDIKINLELNSLENCYITTPTHYITINQDLVNFKQFEYIEQTVNGVKASGIFTYYDVVTNRMYYLRISRNEFQSIQDSTLVSSTAISAATSSVANQQYLITGLTTGFKTMPQVNTTETVNSLPNLKSLELQQCFLLVNYIYLDSEERVRFSQGKNEYLIQQLQFVSNKVVESTNRSIKLNLAHPCTVVVWVGQQQYLVDTNNNDLFNYTDDYKRNADGSLVGKNLITSGTILLNGQERLSVRDTSYFNWVQPFQHFSFAPNEGINVYSFSIYPEILQPSGSCNMTKIDDILLQVSMSNIINFSNQANVRCYGLNYNILRITHGLGGLVFTF